MSTAVTCLAIGTLSIATLTQPVNAQASGDSQRAAASILEEIVVTAQRREESLQDVPIAISVLSGDTLDSSTERSVVEALSHVAGVYTPIDTAGARNGGSAVVTIRGVAPTLSSATTGYYLDNVPFSFARTVYAPDSNAYDLDRVEVLRGPQGTLYGANALNGVIRVLTRNPDLRNFEFKARASVSSTDHGSESYAGDAAVNVPLIEDKLAMRVVLGEQQLGGWIDKPIAKDANYTDKSNARLKLAARPTDNFSVGLSAWFSRTENGAPSSTENGLTSQSRLKELSSQDFDAYNLELIYDTRFFSIKSATSYMEYNNYFDFDFTPTFPNETVQMSRWDDTVFAEELVLTSVGEGPWRWTLGSLYRDVEDVFYGFRSLLPAPNNAITTAESIAVFGELTRAFADGRFEVTGGLRYFREDLTDRETSRSVPGGIPPGGLLRLEDTFKKTTPRVVLAWHPNPDASLYASYSRGFRSGIHQLFNVAAAGVPPAGPDVLSNYEIGAKGGTFGGRLAYDVAVYYIDWQDLQQTASVTTPTGPLPGFINGESASGLGVDVGLTYAPVEAVRLGLNYGWSDLTLDKDTFASALGVRVLQAPQGSRVVGSPEHSVGATVDFNFPLGSSGYRGRFGAAGNYTSERITAYSAFANPPRWVQRSAGSMTVVRASAGFTAPKNWTANLFVDNLTNEDGLIEDANSPRWNTYMRPRTYGVQLEYRH